MFTLTFTTNNAAFEDDAAPEIGRILRELAVRVAHAGERGGTIRDVNGNTVGHYTLD